MSVSADPATVQTHRVRSRVDEVLAPDAPDWERAAEAIVALEPTPLDRQPSAYVQVSWADRRRSDIDEVRVRALTTAGGIALRLEWETARPHRIINDVNVYADACAVLFPGDGARFELATMGTPEHPVHGWHWRAGTEEPFVINATGLGTVERATDHEVMARARWSDGRWQVVLARPLKAPGVGLTHGSIMPVGFAVWSGSTGERAGLKVYSPQPHELRIGD